MREKSQTRSYRSALRAEQAAGTRQRILEAAAASFTEDGYHGTSLASIARRAGVSAETVKAQGPKRELLLRAFAQSFSGSDSEELLADRESGATLAGLADGDELLAATAAFIAAANSRTSALWAEILSAANADPEIAQALEALLARRRRDYLRLVELLKDRGIIAPEQDTDAAADILSFLWSPEGHQQFVRQNNWTMPQYEQWLRQSARHLAGA